jgi:hypothetical protein
MAATMEITDGMMVAASSMNAPNAWPVVVSTSTRISTWVVITKSVAAVSDQKVKDAMRRNMYRSICFIAPLSGCGVSRAA